MTTEEIDALILKNPEISSVREKLEAMKTGAYCMHRAWGLGKITGYDASAERILVDFPEVGKVGHRMDPGFCADKLEILPENHVLVRKYTDAATIEKLVKSDPVQLVKEILSVAPDHKMTATEIELVLNRLLGPAKMKKWWTATKKLLQKDPSVGVPAKKEGEFELRDKDDEVSPEREILEEYYRNKNPKKKILLAEKLFQFSSVKTGDELPQSDPSMPQPLHHYKASDPEIVEDLHKIFEELTDAIKAAKRLTKAECLYGLWVRNDLCRFFKEDVDSLEPTSKSVVLSCSANELNEVAQQIPQTPACLKRLLDLLSRVYADNGEWKNVTLKLLEDSTGKFTGECVTFLVDRGEDKLLSRKLQEWLDGQTLRSPVLCWVIKNRNSRKYQKIIRPLMTHRLLSAILYAIDREAVMSTTNRRIQLAEDLSDDYGLIADLLEDANEEIARDLAQALLLNQGFEPLMKKSLFARFIKIYPRIQSILFGSSSEENEPEVSNALIVSAWSMQERRNELEDIIKVQIPANKEAIAIAKEHGDLKENSEYKMARQDQETLLARKGLLESELERAHVTDFSDTPTDKVGVGSIVELVPASGGTVVYTILGAWDSNPEENILSYKTPLAQALIGKSVGDVVETLIDGNKEAWTVKSMSRWIDRK